MNNLIKKLKVHKFDSIALILASLTAIIVLTTPTIQSNFVKARGSSRPFLVNVDVINIPIVDQKRFISEVLHERYIFLSVRHQQAGRLKVIDIQPISNNMKELTTSYYKSRNPEYIRDSTLNVRFTLKANGFSSSNGFVISGSNMKIGYPIVLEGKKFRVPGTVTDLQKINTNQ